MIQTRWNEKSFHQDCKNYRPDENRRIRTGCAILMGGIVMPTFMGIDIETYSSTPLPRCGVYRYCDAPDFEILLFSYAFDDAPVETVDLACGESLPKEVLLALEAPNVLKVAYNAQFERVCLSKYLGHWLDPHQWRCTMVMAASLTLPGRLADVAVALGTAEKKMEEGKELIRYFSFPCKPTKANGGRTRNRPSDAPEKWAVYKQYNAQDVETERAIRKALEKYPLPEQEWAYYALDQQINDRGVRVDKQLVKNAIAADAVFAQAAYQRAKELTGLENPGSVMQLHRWLRERGVQLSTLLKKEVQRKLAEMDEDAQPDAQADEAAREMLRLRLEMSRSSIKKYEAMARCVCKDGRIHGMFRFYGASRTGRFASQIVNLQNLRRNDMEDLALARSLLREGRAEELSMLYASAADVLSELVRTALIARKGCRFIVADFSAIEARVLAWLAGEEWRLKVFEEGGDIYCASASQMFHVPVEKHGVNGHLRQKGKISELALGYGGSIGALQAMGSREMNIPDEELKPLVDGWRKANPRIVQFWRSVGDAAMKAVREQTTVRAGKVTFCCKDGVLFANLPSGRTLAYLAPRLETGRFGSTVITYQSYDKTEKAADEEDEVPGVRRWQREETYGPKIVENLTQAIARDLLCAAMMNLEAAGYRICMHVHDECVIEMPVSQGSLEEACRLMAIAPDWAEDLPLRADGEDHLAFYRKT